MAAAPVEKNNPHVLASQPSSRNSFNASSSSFTMPASASASGASSGSSYSSDSFLRNTSTDGEWRSSSDAALQQHRMPFLRRFMRRISGARQRDFETRVHEGVGTLKRLMREVFAEQMNIASRVDALERGTAGGSAFGGGARSGQASAADTTGVWSVEAHVDAAMAIVAPRPNERLAQIGAQAISDEGLRVGTTASALATWRRRRENLRVELVANPVSLEPATAAAAADAVLGASPVRLHKVVYSRKADPPSRRRRSHATGDVTVNRLSKVRVRARQAAQKAVAVARSLATGRACRHLQLRLSPVGGMLGDAASVLSPVAGGGGVLSPASEGPSLFRKHGRGAGISAAWMPLRGAEELTLSGGVLVVPPSNALGPVRCVTISQMQVQPMSILAFAVTAVREADITPIQPSTPTASPNSLDSTLSSSSISPTRRLLPVPANTGVGVFGFSSKDSAPLPKIRSRSAALSAAGVAELPKGMMASAWIQAATKRSRRSPGGAELPSAELGATIGSYLGDRETGGWCVAISSSSGDDAPASASHETLWRTQGEALVRVKPLPSVAVTLGGLVARSGEARHESLNLRVSIGHGED